MKYLAQTIASLTFLGLLLSVTYNIGYFSKISWTLLSSLSIEDHISSGIAFLPITLIFVLVSIVFGILWPKKKEENDEERSKLKNQFKTFIKEDSIIVSFIFTVYLFFLPYDDYLILIVLLLGIFPLLFVSIVRKLLKKFSIELSEVGIRTFFLLTVLFLVVCFFGGLKAYSDLTLDSEKFTETVEIDGKLENIHVLRYLKHGYLANTTNGVILIYQGDVINVKTPNFYDKPTLYGLVYDFFSKKE